MFSTLPPKNHLSIRLIYVNNQVTKSPAGWGCRIHWLLLCKRIDLHQCVSWIWHETIWWYGSNNAGALGNAEYSFIAIDPWSTLARSGSTWKVRMYGPNILKQCIRLFWNCVFMLNWTVWNFKEIYCVLMLNWMFWNWTVFTLKLCTYSKLNWFK